MSGFLILDVLLPSLAKVGARAALGSSRAGRLRPALKLGGKLVLLALCYANAAGALPQTARHPDRDYLAAMLTGMAVMCGSGFAAGGCSGGSAAPTGRGGPR